MVFQFLPIFALQGSQKSNKSVKCVREQFLSKRNLVEKVVFQIFVSPKLPHFLLYSQKVDKDANDYSAKEVTVLSEPFAQLCGKRSNTKSILCLNCLRWGGFISEE